MSPQSWRFCAIASSAIAVSMTLLFVSHVLKEEAAAKEEHKPFIIAGIDTKFCTVVHDRRRVNELDAILENCTDRACLDKYLGKDPPTKIACVGTAGELFTVIGYDVVAMQWGHRCLHGTGFIPQENMGVCILFDEQNKETQKIYMTPETMRSWVCSTEMPVVECYNRRAEQVLPKQIIGPLKPFIPPLGDQSSVPPVSQAGGGAILLLLLIIILAASRNRRY